MHMVLGSTMPAAYDFTSLLYTKLLMKPDVMTQNTGCVCQVELAEAVAGCLLSALTLRWLQGLEC